MDLNQPLQLLGGLSPSGFMRRYWQRKPLLVRQAIAGFSLGLARGDLFALAARDEVESRLVIGPIGDEANWQMRHGPFARRALPPLQRKGWTLLVQGVDLQLDSVHALLNRFRFAPDARIDDVMVSYATDQGGVGPHFDSYDVFLLQAHGRRRWRIGRQKDLSLLPGMPIKILRNFAPEQEFELDAGDMLYLPPGYAHEGVAIGECMTYSVGFRAPSRGELAAELMHRLASDELDASGDVIYRDASDGAVETPGAIPLGLKDFARSALQRTMRDSLLLERALGEYLTEPKALVWFEAGADGAVDGPIRLDRKTRMMYDQRCIYVNGESYRASGRDAALLHRLADSRCLDAADVSRASAQVRAMLIEWSGAGWLHVA